MTHWKIPYIQEATKRESVINHLLATERLAKQMDQYLDKALAGVHAEDLNLLLANILDAAIESYGESVKTLHDDDLRKTDELTHVPEHI